MNNQFSENLKKIRKENNLSQEQLADELGVSRQAISKWESSQAYPEMDKIIALCNRFNLNIDDLLHKDINEVKGEEESKKNINNFINDFLKFITDSVNLFSSMSFKSKMKCLFEQLIIIVCLVIASNVIISVISSLFTNIFRFLPNNVFLFTIRIIDSILGIVCFIASLIILAHIFKTRYLDYYNKTKKEEVEPIEVKEEKVEVKPVKKTEQKKDDKIIIRDPNHSEYRFINGLFKIIVAIIKFFALWIALGIAFGLIGLFGTFILSFLVYKTGTVFFGLVLTVLSSTVIGIVILLLLLNFVFNRKNDKKKMIWAFIISLLICGAGWGLIVKGALNFEVLDNNETMLKTVETEHKMTKDLVIDVYSEKEIKYKETKIDNIKIEYSINKYCDINEITDKNNIMANVNCNNIPEMTRDILKNINNKKLIPIDTDVNEVTIYASKENIIKLKDNYKKYLKEKEKELEEQEKENERIINYEETINNLQEENDALKERINDLENNIPE